MRTLGVFFLALTLSACASLRQPAEIAAAAEQAYLAGDYAAAAETYRALGEQGRLDAEGWFRLGNAYAESGRLVEAAEAFRAALENDPKHARAAHNLGLVYLQLGVTTLLDARRQLPPVDDAAAETMKYLACVMERFLGQPDPVTCRGDTGSD